jgi:hypothetical protein
MMPWDSAAVAAIAAACSAIATFMTVWRQGKSTRYTVSAQIAWELDRNYHVDDFMITRRRAAARALLQEEGGWTAEVDEVLNFLDSVGMFLRRGIIDEEMAFSSFGRCTLCYRHYANKRIEAVRGTDPTGWSDGNRLATQTLTLATAPVDSILCGHGHLPHLTTGTLGPDPTRSPGLH